jgi:hypothetical protein
VFQNIRGSVFGLVLSLLALPVALSAQVVDGGNLPAMPVEAQQALREMEQIQMRLSPMQERALQDSALNAEGAQIGTRVRQAMDEVDSQTASRIARLNELMTVAQAAQARQDAEAYATAATEATRINQDLQLTQEAAVAKAEIAASIEAFEKRVQAKMIADNPEAQGLLSRLEELNTQLTGVMQQLQQQQ